MVLYQQFKNYILRNLRTSKDKFYIAKEKVKRNMVLYFSVVLGVLKWHTDSQIIPFWEVYTFDVKVG